MDVKQANQPAPSFVSKAVTFKVVPTTRISPDDEKALISDLRAGDAAVVKSKAAQGATSFTASIIKCPELCATVVLP